LQENNLSNSMILTLYNQSPASQYKLPCVPHNSEVSTKCPLGVSFSLEMSLKNLKRKSRQRALHIVLYTRNRI